MVLLCCHFLFELFKEKDLFPPVYHFLSHNRWRHFSSILSWIWIRYEKLFTSKGARVSFQNDKLLFVSDWLNRLLGWYKKSIADWLKNGVVTEEWLSDWLKNETDKKHLDLIDWNENIDTKETEPDWYDTKLHLVVRLQFWSSWKWGILFHCHYF